MEIRIESVNKDNSHSWVRILNKLVTELSKNKESDDNEQETSEMQFYALIWVKQNHKDVFLPVHTVPHGKRTWTDIEPHDYSPSVEEIDQSSSSW